MVKISGLRKKYGNFNVLDGLDMTINKGDVYGFLGRNGCGKTTTMNILCNIIPKDEGEIILGENPDDRIKIGYLPETPSLYGYMNGYEYLEYIAACANFKGNAKQRICECLEITGMIDGGKRRIKGYSRGMNQRLGIAAAIFDSPDLLILDEPTSALDPEGRAEVMQIIQRLTGTGATILLCTHILSDVERVSNRIGIMRDGRLAVEGTIDEIIGRDTNNGITLQLFDVNEETAAKIKAVEFADKVDFYEKTGNFVLRTANPEETNRYLVKFLAENNLVPRKIEVSRPSLEDVFLRTVN